VFKQIAFSFIGHVETVKHENLKVPSPCTYKCRHI